MQLSASLVLLSLSLIMGQQTDLCRGGPVQRKSLNQMSQSEIDAFVAAVKAVSNDPANRWGEYAKLHAEVYQGVHVNPKFLPWHRIFVRKMEQFLQEKNPSVTIPYWDWAQYSQNPENDPIFTDRIAGGDGNPSNNDCISNGQFADLKVDYTHGQNSNTRCIKRRMTKKDANGLVWTSSDTIDNMLNSSSFKDFAESIEQGSHGIIHNCIGSEFAGHASPNDPIFYLHHGFIDKIWYDWQKRNPQLANTYNDDINANLDRLGFKVSDALDSDKSVCVSYPEDRFKWNTNQQVPAPQVTTTAAPAPAPQPTTAAPVAPATTAAPAPINPTPNNPNPQPIPSSQPVADQATNPAVQPPVQPPVPTTQAVPVTTTVPAPATTNAAVTTTIAPVAPVAPVVPVAPQPINNGTTPILSRRGYSVIAPEPYQVKCRSKEERAKYDAWYVHHDIDAPSADDRKDLHKIRVPSQIDNDFIKRWGFNHTLVRQLERKNALLIHKLNKDPNHKSPDALINFPKFNPELKKDDCESKKTTTTNAYPVKPIATTTTTNAYPVKPIATTTTTTTTNAYPVKPIATTTTTNAYPVKPIATTTNAYPVKPVPTTNAYPVKPLPTTEAYPVKPAPTYEAAYPIKQY